MKDFNAEEREINTFNDLNDTLYKSAWISQFLSGLMQPIMMFVGNLGYVLVSIIGGFLAIKGSIEVGDIQAFIQYVRSFTQPIAQTAQIANVLQSTAAAAERVFEFLEEPEEVDTAKGEIDTSKLKGNVEFKNVKFGYDPDKIIINNFNATVKEGQKIAIVGPTGAGKTTMVKLLMRFYDVNSGTIKVSGHDIRKITRESLRDNYGMVLQETWIKNGTVRDNISIGKPEATDTEIIEAAKLTHCLEFIRRLPKGLDTILNEDSLSQGQKQLLCIARVMLCLPPMLILDEATSSIDTRTEIKIQQAFASMMKGRTSFIVAHRLSTIREADIILVMDSGKVIEQGTHEELLAEKGFYAKLYNSQYEL